jgi:hypothetical protein
MYFNPSFQQIIPPSLRDLLDGLKYEIFRDLNCARPGVIQSFNAALQEATVQIAIQQVVAISPTGVQTIQSYPVLASVPVYFPSGGGFTLTFPVSPGDECLVIFNDRQIDNWLTSGAGNAPSVPRLHDLSDGVALVGLRNNTRALGGVSTNTAQLRSDDGTTYVEVAGGGIVNVVAPTQINLNSPIVNIAGVINVQNENSVTNSCTINGTIIATGDVQSDNGGHKLNTHLHSSVQSGDDDTGGPVG